MLSAVAVAFAYAAGAAYEYVRDAFVAPAILSPNSDLVITNRLRLGELEVERERAVADIEALDADLSGADSAIAGLQKLQKTAASAIEWTSTVTAEKANATVAQLHALSNERQLMVTMVEDQKKQTAKAEADVASGLIPATEYARRKESLNQAEIALLDNDRSSLQLQSSLEETALAQRALARPRNAPQMPELIAQQEQMIRVELEIVRLTSEQRSKTGQKKALTERVAKIDEMARQLKSRPTYQAIEKNIDIAFVPYTQIDGVSDGAPVYSCLWGIIFCKEVGAVTQLVPGEVSVADPWGAPARGQYAVLDLYDHESARAKTLRVRSWDAHRPAASAPAAGSEVHLSAR